jgi:hypothetical protein
MMAVRQLSVDIISMLKGNGFQKLDDQVGKAKTKISRMSKLADNSFVRMGTGFFGAAAAVEVYKKAIEGANVQLEQEMKLRSTLTAQGFSKDQIQGVKDYASELQNLGVVGDEVTLAGAQQLATYNLTEQQLKDLLPALQDVSVQQEGLNVSTGGAISVANMMGKAIMGQVGALSEAGITLNDYQTEMIKTGNQSQKVAALIEAVTMNVGEQNKEAAKTPMGRIKQVENAIGDVYEEIGFQLMRSRASFYDFIGDNLEGIKNFVLNGANFFQDFGSGVMKVISSIWEGFKNMPSDVKLVIEAVAAFFLISTFPIAGAVVVLQDIWAAFSGGKSVTEDVFNSVMDFLGIGYKFKEFRGDVKELWATFQEGEYLKSFFESIGLVIRGALINPLKAVIKMLKGDFKGAWEVMGDTGSDIKKFSDNVMQREQKRKGSSLTREEMQYAPALSQGVLSPVNITQGVLSPVNITQGEQKRKGSSLTREEMQYTPALSQGVLSPVNITQGSITITQATDINGIEKIITKKNNELLESVFTMQNGRGRQWVY